MSGIEEVLPFIAAAGAAAGVVGQQQQAQAAQVAAKEKQNELNYESAQLRQQAGQDQASAQRAAEVQRHQAAVMQGRVQAVAAASGASATDPTVLNLQGGIAAKGDYAARAAIYEGDTSAEGKDAAAKARDYESYATGVGSKYATEGANIRTAGTILSSGASIYNDYYKKPK